MTKFVLTLYVVGKESDWASVLEHLEGICKNDLAGHYGIQPVYVADGWELSRDMRIFVPNAVVLWLPSPLQEPMSELVRGKSGLVGLDLRRIDCKDDARVRVDRGQGLPDQSGSLRRRLCQLEGELAERTAELTKTREALRQIERALSDNHRLAMIGVMAAGIAHDINNPLGAALTSAETALMVKDQPDNAEVFERCMQNIVGSIRRCGQIGKSLLEFARQGQSKRSRQDLNDVVRGACDAVRSYLKRHRATIHLSLDEHLPKIMLSRLEIEQVLINLIQNAVQATEGPAVITIRTGRTADSVWITVRDNGTGISEEQKQRLFDPLFTTRQEQGGTGLGLSVSNSIVRSYGGSIDVDSVVGEGTTVAVTLPLDKAASIAPPAMLRASRRMSQTTDKK